MNIPTILEQSVFPSFVDPTVDEVVINGTGCMARYYQCMGCKLLSSPYETTEQLIAEMQLFCRELRVRLDPNCPAAGGDLIWHSHGEEIHMRWHILIAPIVREGAVLSLRRHRLKTLNIEHFQMGEAECNRMRQMFAEGSPIFFCGETGSGKTSLLNALLKTSARHERIIIIERSPELDLVFPTWVRLISARSDLEGRGEFTLKDVFEQALRLRPDRIIVGEIRGEEAAVAFQAMISGHRSLVSTIHISSPSLLVPRLTQLTGGSEFIDWKEIFMLVRPYVVMMKRGSPHGVEGIYRFDGNGCLTSCDQSQE